MAKVWHQRRIASSGEACRAPADLLNQAQADDRANGVPEISGGKPGSSLTGQVLRPLLPSQDATALIAVKSCSA